MDTRNLNETEMESLSTSTSPSLTNESSPPGRTVGPFGIEPFHLLLFSAVPLYLGAYIGFQKQMQLAAKEATSFAATTPDPAALEGIGLEALSSSPKISVDAKRLAARAFGIGTLLTLGSFSAVGAILFYSSGCKSVQEAMDCTRAWGRKRKADIDGWVGVDLSKNDLDKIATKGMSEDEELKYIQEKYMSEEIMMKDP